jgi:hypothetical protein
MSTTVIGVEKNWRKRMTPYKEINVPIQTTMFFSTCPKCGRVFAVHLLLTTDFTTSHDVWDQIPKYCYMCGTNMEEKNVNNKTRSKS